jgi:sugar phosphate isomerase/epimerase
MRTGENAACHLTYCTNVHAGESWPEMRAALARHLPAVKARVSPDRSFGVGLRLSAAAAEALSDTATLEEFRDFLRTNGLYVFTINGFPHGAFHGDRIKEKVYLPDWRDNERLRYTNRLAGLLADLLPEGERIEGSISTVPGAFRAHIGAPAEVAEMAERMIHHAACLVELHEKTGRTIVLALEPEPACLLETSADTVRFFDQHLFSRTAAERLARLAGLSRAQAERAARTHLGVCLDACHAAVAFEEPGEAVAAYRAAGISIAKLQISAALRIPSMTEAMAERLRPFAEEVYLHQVVERNGAGFRRFADLPDALAAWRPDDPPREWRVHYHVPVFREELGPLRSTQPFLHEMLELHRAAPISPHLEVETYSWGVLPEAYRAADLGAALARELLWVGEQLAR